MVLKVNRKVSFMKVKFHTQILYSTFLIIQSGLKLSRTESTTEMVDLWPQFQRFL
jgi:hypothetical protein